MMNIALSGLLVILTAAVITDIKFNRIPNVICIFGVCVGIFWHISIASLPEALFMSLSGMFIAGIILMPFYALGVMAAGDVKLMASVGCILGGFQALEAAMFSLISGSLLGIAFYILHGGWEELKDLFSRYLFAAKCSFRTGRLSLPAKGTDEIATSRFPYATAIFAGSLLAVNIGFT